MIYKKASETINSSITFTQALSATETVVSIINTNVTPSGATISASVISDDTKGVILTITGGTDNTYYTISVAVLTTGGQRLVYHETLSVSDKQSIPSWDISMTIMLRSMIGDSVHPYQYPDRTLRSLIAVSGILVCQDLAFNYIVDVANITISPDPVINNDMNFMALTCYKAALLLADGEHRNAAKMAIVHKDGPASIDAKGIGDNLKIITAARKKQYEDAAFDYKIGNGSPGVGIVGAYNAFITPYVSSASALGIIQNRQDTSSYFTG